MGIASFARPITDYVATFVKLDPAGMAALYVNGG